MDSSSYLEPNCNCHDLTMAIWLGHSQLLLRHKPWMLKNKSLSAYTDAVSEGVWQWCTAQYHSTTEMVISGAITNRPGCGIVRDQAWSSGLLQRWYDAPYSISCSPKIISRFCQILHNAFTRPLILSWFWYTGPHIFCFFFIMTRWSLVWHGAVLELPDEQNLDTITRHLLVWVVCFSYHCLYDC